MEKYEILIGDATETLRTLPDQSVHCCVTSPPYFGLRDYGRDGQIGLEETPEAFVESLVEVFREVRRVLRDDGTVWLNLGDSYNGVGRGYKANGMQVAARSSTQRTVPGLKPKDLIGIPWRVAFALQADGWYLRQDIIWHKPNPMPESVRDRCTKAHEYVFLLSKSPRYYFDAEAVKEDSVSAKNDRTPAPRGSEAYANASGVNGQAQLFTRKNDGTRNRRSVWTITAKPYKGAHFATFPPDLIEPCILAGCPEGGTVLDPFGGSGTTAGVANAHGRQAILCELNPEYAALAEDRVRAIVRNYKERA